MLLSTQKGVQKRLKKFRIIESTQKWQKVTVLDPPFHGKTLIFQTLFNGSKAPKSTNRCQKGSKTIQKEVQKRSKSDPFEFVNFTKKGSKKNLSSEKSRLEKQEEMWDLFFAPETPKTKMTTSNMSIYYNGMLDLTPPIYSIPF